MVPSLAYRVSVNGQTDGEVVDRDLQAQCGPQRVDVYLNDVRHLVQNLPEGRQNTSEEQVMQKRDKHIAFYVLCMKHARG